MRLSSEVPSPIVPTRKYKKFCTMLPEVWSMIYIPKARPKPGDVQSRLPGCFCSKPCCTMRTQIQRDVKRPHEKMKP